MSLAVTALLSGCEDSTNAKRAASLVSTTSMSSVSAPKQIVGIAHDMADKSHATNPQSKIEESNATTPTLDAEAEQLKTSRLLHDADRTSTAFRVIGPHTKNAVALYQFFESAGWNDFLDGLTMKSCPDGYEFFCQTRGIFVELYEKSGGDVNLLIEVARSMDFREHFHRLASAADMYRTQYQPISHRASN